ncbi:MAG: metallophosphoesterase [Faecalibacterium sp.]|nr:metallophosphoesterase [Ruminococcus sp.]MCM1392919.1 metallophosphoesterase [Ruminococcus sp.]MCM1486159.1 metallophosphoesterase [Faecalibacterium sp.]
MSRHKTKLTFIADTHHFSLSLAKDGRAYDLRSDSDQKCLKETGGIIDAAFSDIALSDTDAVMIIGDLTNDGERVCHEEFREKLYALKNAKSVYVITATHDWCCDENPRKYDGDTVSNDVPTMMHDELRDFYYDFGPKQAKSEFITHLGTCSYTVDIGDDVRLLALNDDQNGKGRAGFKEDHFCWIEEQIRQAKNDGRVLIAMEHHLIMPNVHALITGGGTCVGDREEVASRLADAGLKYMFVGHSHMQGIDTFTSQNGNTITQFNVGSLCGYPSPIVNVIVSDGKLEVETNHVSKFSYNGRIYDAEKYLSANAYTLIDRLIETADADKSEFRDRLTALQLDGEAFQNLYLIAKPLFKALSKSTVKDVYKLLKPLKLADNVNSRDINILADKPIVEIIHEMMLSFMDGTTNYHEQGSAYYNVVMGAADALVKIKRCKLTLDVRETLHNLLVKREFDINHCVI